MAKKNAAKSSNETETQLGLDYDDFPYESYPFAHTNPAYLYSIAKIFGVDATPIAKARILELGCAAGSNIIKLAEANPKAHFVGIDISNVEIEHGQKITKDLGLKNIELKTISITDLDESFGQFDYIITHGIFSWVPDLVKEKILEISKKLLAKNGLAYISYNTLPGWNMVNTIRDMMLFHSANFEKSKDKVQQARLFLNFVTDSLENTSSPYSNFLKSEAQLLAKHNDSYLRHDHLSSENKQFYFHEFMTLARQHKLTYLADSNLNTMFLGNLPPKVAEQLSAVQDIVRTEQYVDFILNRRFRCTILCHEDVKINRALTADNFKNLYLTAPFIMPETPLNEVDLKDNTKNLSFYFSEDKVSNVISTTSPIMKAVFYTYIENLGNPLNSKEIAKLAQIKLPNFTLENFLTELDTNLGRLVLSGYFKFFGEKPRSIFTISDKPLVSEYARYQVANGQDKFIWLTNEVNDILALDGAHVQQVVLLLDGKNNMEQIKEKILDKFLDGTIQAHENDIRIIDRAKLKNIAASVVDSTLAKLKNNYVLIG